MRVARKVKLEASGLAPHLFTVLAQCEHEPRTATDLAQCEQVTAASMSRTIAELEQRGLIARLPHPTDGRTRLISPTDAGRAELAAGRRRRDTWMQERLAECTDDERRTLEQAATILERFVGGAR